MRMPTGNVQTTASASAANVRRNVAPSASRERRSTRRPGTAQEELQELPRAQTERTRAPAAAAPDEDPKRRRRDVARARPARHDERGRRNGRPAVSDLASSASRRARRRRRSRAERRMSIQHSRTRSSPSIEVRAAEALRPRDERAPEELVHGDDHERHRDDRPGHRPSCRPSRSPRPCTSRSRAGGSRGRRA